MKFISPKESKTKNMIKSDRRLTESEVTKRIIRYTCEISESGLNGRATLYNLEARKRVRLDQGDKSRLRRIIELSISEMSPEERDLLTIDSDQNLIQYAVNLLYNFYSPSYNI
jgi:hypothetical protein